MGTLLVAVVELYMPHTITTLMEVFSNTNSIADNYTTATTTTTTILKDINYLL
jgi:hypothetical protein